jgi:serine/threonine protein kinase
MSANTSRTVGPESVEWSCPAGHRWQDRPELLSVCPECGERGVPAPSQGDSTTFAPRGARLASATAGLPGGAMPDVPGYEVLEELGRGGMGVVYKARQTGLNRLVALKMILPGSRSIARFETEAKAVAQLRHPAIVQVYAVDSWQPADGGPPVPYFSMEYCPGGTLEQFLDSTPLPPLEAAKLVALLARAIAHAHSQNVIHRDLKPGNVLLAREVAPPGEKTQASGKITDRPGEKKAATTMPPVESIEPKVADFGLAKLLDEQSHTRTGDVMGTPSYMAPEQAEGKGVGPPADIWALGAILYECLTGHPPFRGSTSMETMMAVMNVEPVPPRRLNPAVPPDLDTICLKCLQKEPRRRYAGGAELADDLERFVRGEPIQARPVGRFERLWRWAGQKHNRVVAGLAVAVALLVLLLALTLSGRPRPDDPQALRADVAYFSRRLGDARREAKRAREEREQWEEKLRGVEKQIAWDRDKKAGSKMGKKMAGLQAEAAAVKAKIDSARKLEEGTAHHESQMQRELDLRERQLHDLEERLKAEKEKEP